jgi:hypothetical protein
LTVKDKDGDKSGMASQSILVGTGSAQTLTLQPDATTGIDAYISNYPAYINSNFGTFGSFAAVAKTSSGTFYLGRSLIQFDLSSIPSTTTITSAKLSLYDDPTSSQGTHDQTSGSNAAYLARIVSSWTESTVTWTNQPSTTSTNEVTLPASTSSNQDYTDIDVTSLVQDQISNPSTSYGFMLSLVTEVQYRGLVFASSDHATTAKHPKLVVTY